MQLEILKVVQAKFLEYYDNAFQESWIPSSFENRECGALLKKKHKNRFMSWEFIGLPQKHVTRSCRNKGILGVLKIGADFHLKLKL